MALPAPFHLIQGQLGYPPEHDHEAETLPLPVPIFAALPDTNIGEIYRGDTVMLPIWYALDYYDGENPGAPIDLTGATLWFTAKIDLADDDAAPSAIQRNTANGGAVIEEPTVGAYRVWIDPTSTNLLDDDTMYIFDVQVRTPGAAPRTVTVRRGIMKVLRDVTRATA